MSDTERVVEIIRVMGMNNIQFSQKTGISPASLSHITSGRSNPTLTILRNIVESFPELNPEWVLLGRGDMFRNASTPENDQNTGANSLDDAAISPTGGNLSQENGLFTNEDFAPSFDFGGSNTPSESTRQGTTRQAVPGRSEQRYGNDGYGVKSSNTARSAYSGIFFLPSGNFSQPFRVLDFTKFIASRSNNRILPLNSASFMASSFSRLGMRLTREPVSGALVYIIR